MSTWREDRSDREWLWREPLHGWSRTRPTRWWRWGSTAGRSAAGSSRSLSPAGTTHTAPSANLQRCRHTPARQQASGDPSPLTPTLHAVKWRQRVCDRHFVGIICGVKGSRFARVLQIRLNIFISISESARWNPYWLTTVVVGVVTATVRTYRNSLPPSQELHSTLGLTISVFYPFALVVSYPFAFPKRSHCFSFSPMQWKSKQH